MASSIDYGNPITSGLFACYLFTDGNTDNLVNGSDTLIITGDAFLDPDGLNAPAGGSGLFTGASLVTPPAAFKPTEVTIMWYGRILGNGVISNNPFLAGMFYDSINAPPFVSYAIARSAIGQNNLYGFYSEAGNSHNIFIGGGIDTSNYGNFVQYIFTRTSGSSVVYQDGVSIGSDSTVGAGDISYGIAPIFAVNRHLNISGDSANTNTASVFIWNRVLTSLEIAELTSNPRAFLTGGANVGTCDMGFEMNLNAVAGLIKSGTCIMSTMFQLQCAAIVESNASVEMSGELTISAAASLSISGTCEMIGETVWQVIGKSSAVKFDCVAGTDTVPTETPTNNTAFMT